MAQIGTVWLEKTLLHMPATKPKTTFSSTKDNWPSYCTKLVDLLEPYFYHNLSQTYINSIRNMCILAIIKRCE